MNFIGNHLEKKLDGWFGRQTTGFCVIGNPSGGDGKAFFMQINDFESTQ